RQAALEDVVQEQAGRGEQRAEEGHQHAPAVDQATELTGDGVELDHERTLAQEVPWGRLFEYHAAGRDTTGKRRPLRISDMPNSGELLIRRTIPGRRLSATTGDDLQLGVFQHTDQSRG